MVLALIGQRSFASLDHHRTGTIAEKRNPRFEILPEKQADSPFGANPHGGAFLQSVVGMRDDLFVLDQPVGGRTVKCVAILANADGGVAFFPEYEPAPTNNGTTVGSGTIGGTGSKGTGTVGSGIRGSGGSTAIRK